MSLWSMAGCSGLSQSHSCVWAQLQLEKWLCWSWLGSATWLGHSWNSRTLGCPTSHSAVSQPGLVQIVMSGLQKNEQKHGWPLEAYAWNWPIIPPPHSSGSSWPRGQWVGEQIPLLVGRAAESLCQVTAMWQTQRWMESCGRFCSPPHLGKWLSLVKLQFSHLWNRDSIAPLRITGKIQCPVHSSCLWTIAVFTLVFLLFHISQWLHLFQWMNSEFLSAANKAFVIWTLSVSPSTFSDSELLEAAQWSSYMTGAPMFHQYHSFRWVVHLLVSWTIRSEVVQSYPALWDPMDCSLSGSSVHGIFQARVLEWITIFFSRGSSRPRNRTRVSRIAGRCFTIWATRETIRRAPEIQSTLGPIACPPPLPWRWGNYLFFIMVSSGFVGTHVEQKRFLDCVVTKSFPSSGFQYFTQGSFTLVLMCL